MQKNYRLDLVRCTREILSGKKKAHFGYFGGSFPYDPAHFLGDPMEISYLMRDHFP